MATIKSFSDLEQSKKLAEFLPLESADMYYFRQIDSDYFPSNVESICPIPLFKDGKEDFKYDIRCWSLAALLELLPKRIEIVDNVYELSVYLYGLYYWNINNGNLCFESKDKDNLVDACYEAMVFLHEQKLL